MILKCLIPYPSNDDQIPQCLTDGMNWSAGGGGRKRDEDSFCLRTMTLSPRRVKLTGTFLGRTVVLRVS